MARELPRTVRTLSPAMQQDITGSDYEIIIVDNGSPVPPNEAELQALAPNLRLMQISDPTPSPVPAINAAIAEARGDLIGVFIDGARMASPRLLATALEAAQSMTRPVVGTVAFHLGPDVQMCSVKNGYCQAVEDELLASVDWQADGYRLFDISVFAGSSERGWFVTPPETNALFLKREHWLELGGYDTGFRAPGGGLANLDIWQRLCEANDITLLFGETTFHQFHGGIATNALSNPWAEFHAEYIALRGKPYAKPTRIPRLFGRPVHAAMPSVRLSVEPFTSERTL